MKLHLPSVLLTVGVVGLDALTSSQSPLLPTGFRIEYLSHPRDYVQIEELTPYTVPNGKLFVLTALGVNGGFTHARLLVDGLTAATVDGAAGSATTMIEVPPGLTVRAGAVLTVVTGGDDGRAWGYLASQ